MHRGTAPERVAEATALHLAVPHLAEQAGEPLESVIATCDRGTVEQLAKHPQCAAQPPDRDPRVVDRVAADWVGALADHRMPALSVS